MKLVITVVGVDRVGIIAGVANVLAEKNVNIVSINQTIMDGFFNMIMMTEADDSVVLEDVQAALSQLGQKLGVEIRAQHASIFTAMHRVG